MGSTTITFASVTGAIGSNSTLDTTADGYSYPGGTNVSSYGSISGVSADREFFLVGVFMGPAGPVSVPSDLNFTGNSDFASLSGLQLGQTFFIGDGGVGYQDASGTLQLFYVPAGATSLYLGFVDALNFREVQDITMTISDL